LSQAGYYFVMQSNQEDIREEMKARVLGTLKDSEMEVVSLSGNQDNISWEETGKEFSLNGKMYDLVKKITREGNVLLYCINDGKEKQLIDRYNEITKQNSAPGKKNISAESITLFVETYSNNKPVILFAESTFSSYISRLESASLEKICPPPQA
jgi:hypothetical protein